MKVTGKSALFTATICTKKVGRALYHAVDILQHLGCAEIKMNSSKFPLITIPSTKHLASTSLLSCNKYFKMQNILSILMVRSRLTRHAMCNFRVFHSLYYGISNQQHHTLSCSYHNSQFVLFINGCLVELHHAGAPNAFFFIALQG